MTPDDEFRQRLDEQSQASRARVRQLLIDEGRPDLLAEYDQRMREIDNGLYGAKGCWDALSSKQRFVLRVMGQGKRIERSTRSRSQFDAIGTPGAVLGICRLPTLRALCARELIHVDGGASDPEARFVITERGTFVLRHGQADA